METLLTLTATVSSGNVVLNWTLAAQANIANPTNVAIQRKLFGSGDDGWSTLANHASPGAGADSYTDTAPAANDYAYRLAITVTQGGVDGAGTLVYSNQVDMSVGPVIILSGSAAAPTGPTSGPANQSVVTLTWAVNVQDYVNIKLQRSLDGGTHWRDAEELDEFEARQWQEQLPNGIGTVSYRALLSTPKVDYKDQLEQPVITTSNTVSVTI